MSAFLVELTERYEHKIIMTTLEPFIYDRLFTGIRSCHTNCAVFCFSIADCGYIKNDNITGGIFRFNSGIIVFFVTVCGYTDLLNLPNSVFYNNPVPQPLLLQFPFQTMQNDKMWLHFLSFGKQHHFPEHMKYHY